jgi:uncharacterized phage protein (TIGR02218 family)
MRNIPTALQTHLDGEVLTLADCLKIERNDGIVIYLTNHDRDLTVNGAVYQTGATFNMSAIKASADLSVDNAQLDVGVDGTLIKKVDFDTTLYRRAKIEVITVNWQNPSDGQIVLTRGWIGDLTIRNTGFATFQLRGLTQALQRNFMQFYSPTCRAVFGDAKCGVPATPFNVHGRNRSYKVGDWTLVPTSVSNFTPSNGSFETQGAVANASSGITGWTHGPGSWWSIESTTGASSGTFYLRGGNDGGANAPGSGLILFRDVLTSALSLADGTVDTGGYVVSLGGRVKAPNPAHVDFARMSVAMYDAGGVLLKVVAGEYFKPSTIWEEQFVTTFVVPNTRSVRVTLEGVKSTGAVDVAFDDVQLYTWTASVAAYNGVAYKAVRIPGYVASDRKLPTNYRFVDNGLVANSNTSGAITGWTRGAGDYWQIVATAGALAPSDGVYFLRGGDNGSATAAQVYTLNSSTVSFAALNTALIASGDYLFEAQVDVANVVNLLSNYKVQVTFFNAANTALSSVDSGFLASAAIDIWSTLKVRAIVPVGSSYAKIVLIARSGTNSAANVAFDAVKAFTFNLTLGNTNDPRRGRSAATRPTFPATFGGIVVDGEIIWKAFGVSFGFDTVATATDRRVFTGTTISGGQYDFHGAKIIWLTGPNAGSEGSVRTWTPLSKELRLYNTASSAIVVGHKFMFSQGCGKSITDCATRFNNAINFRGEPYLPGPQRIVETFTPQGS